MFYNWNSLEQHIKRNPVDSFINTMEKLGYDTPPSRDALIDPIYDLIDDNVKIYLASIKNQKEDDQWHEIHFHGDESYAGHHFQTFRIAPSAATALAIIISNFDEYKVFITHVVSTSNGTIQFMRNSSIIVEMKKIQFSSVTDANGRMASTFKGVRWPIDCQRLQARLQKIPAFEKTAMDESKRVDNSLASISMVNIRDGLKKLIKEQLGIELKTSSAQDFVVEMFDLKSWHHAIAAEKKGLCRGIPYVILYEKSEYEPHCGTQYFKNFPDALACLQSEIKDKRIRKINFYHLLRAMSVEAIEYEGASQSIQQAEYDEPTENYTHIAKAILDESDIIKAIEKAIACSATKLSNKSFEKAFMRLGVAPDKHLRIKNWIFSVHPFLETESLIVMEQLNQTENKVTKRFNLKAHKTEIFCKDNNSQEIDIITEYGNKFITTLKGFNRKDAEKIAAFLSIGFTSVPPQKKSPP